VPDKTVDEVVNAEDRSSQQALDTAAHESVVRPNPTQYVGTPAIGTSKAAAAAGISSVGPANTVIDRRRRCGKMLRSLQFALHERLINNDFGSDFGEFTPLPRSTRFRMGSKSLCIRSTPTEMQSMSENDFECLASTGVNTPRQCARGFRRSV
jgi:hypothetical protein